MVWFVIFLLCIGLIGNRGVQSHREQAEENQELYIVCGENHGIKIISAKWTYNRAKVINWITPNRRMFSFLWGKYFGIGTWDVTKTVEGICGLEHECAFKPTRSLFGNCGYEMFLDVNYVCIDCTDTKRMKRFSTDRNRCYDYEWQEEPFVDDNNKELCPNKKFEFKHVDTKRENSLESAELVATHLDYRRNCLMRTSPTNIISVFLTGGNLINYVEENSTECKFTTFFPKYNCYKNMETKLWDCKYIGYVIARHRKYNGHYLHYLDTLQS